MTWAAGSEREAVEGGFIDSMNGGERRPPSDFPEAYNWAFDEARRRRIDLARVPRGNTLSPHETAILGIVHLAVFADKNVDPQEINWIYQEAKNHPLFSKVAMSDFRAACMSILQELRETSMVELTQRWVGLARSSFPREAFSLAVSAMLADGVIAKIEEGFTMFLIKHLEIPIEDASAILAEAMDRQGMS
jgi:hypothetical protein